MARGEKDVLEDILTSRARYAPAGCRLVEEGSKAENVRIILEGWAIQHTTLRNGRRQILSFVLPGEACDAFMYLRPHLDFGVETLTDVVYADVPRRSLDVLMNKHPHLARMFFIRSLEDACRKREWMASIGQRTAFQRLAHLCHDCFARMSQIGLVEGGACHFPPTQPDIADHAGISAVHVNRTLQDLRASGLIKLDLRRSLEVPCMEKLRLAALLPSTETRDN